MGPKPTFAELFTPKLVSILREPYGWGDLRADAISGLTVAIVALPLSMAISIASGLHPGRGLTTAIVGGFLVSALGGSRFQIGGPAGAFIIVVSGVVDRHGVDGLVLATAMSGLLMVGMGLLRLGGFVKYIPYPVTVGFTAGIGVIIFVTQIKDLLGLRLTGKEAGDLIGKLPVLAAALPSATPAACLLALGSIGVIVGLRKYRPHWPGMLIAVTAAALIVAIAGLPVETIASKFGSIPNAPPAPHIPAMTLSMLMELMPDALTFAVLGSIESLLSAVVADGMTGRRHRSNCELVGQGIANMGSALFGGFCVTGTVARTVTNVRSGAHGPPAGMFHALFLLGFMVIAAPLAGYIPLAALAAVLTVVAWNMAAPREFALLLRSSRGDATVLMLTFLLVIFRDLMQGILIGFAAGTLLFLHRMAQSVAVDADHGDGDRSDQIGSPDRQPYDPAIAGQREIVIYRITGAFFFGAAARVGAALDQIGDRPQVYVIDLTAVPTLDSTAAMTMEGFAERAQRRGAAIYLTGARPEIRHVLFRHGVKPPLVHYRASIADAVAASKF